jgi:hypothetical protein
MLNNVLKQAFFLFKATRSHTIKTSVLGHLYSNDYIEVLKDGTVTVKASNRYPVYTDGCSPKFLVLGLWVVGTPDGPINCDTGYPQTFWASAIHDILYQALGLHTLSRKECDQIFKDALSEVGFAWPNTYYYGLRLVGGLYHRFVVEKQTKFINHVDES